MECQHKLNFQKKIQNGDVHVKTKKFRGISVNLENKWYVQNDRVKCKRTIERCKICAEKS